MLAQVKRAMNEVDSRLEAITHSVGQMNQSAQAEVQPVLKTLQGQRQELDQLVEQMRGATGETLDQLRNQFETNLRTLLSTLEETEELLAG
jgi:uncharacterized protein YukE